MANPLGVKTFTAGDVLLAAEVNGYLMDQAVAVFDSTAARGSAIASPAEGQFAYLKDSDQLTYYSGAAWQNAAAFAAPVTNRNLIYNGAMQVAQRGTSTASITAGGYYTADRWFHAITTMGTWTDTIENDAPTGSGFRKSLKILCTTADAAPAAGDLLFVDQRLEGQDVQRIRKGTSSAQQLTLSFWVKSNVTGTYVLNLLDNDNSRVVGAQYTISASGTWEKKTITFPADTTGAFDNDNAASLRPIWFLGAGTNFTSGTLNTTWASATDANRAVGQTNLAAATNNYWQITGVQLEVGDTATEFEFKSFGEELRECQRYYWRNTPGSIFGHHPMGGGISTTSQAFNFQSKVSMRATPTAVEFANIEVEKLGVGANAVTALTLQTAFSGVNITRVDTTLATSTINAGEAVFLRNANNTGGYVAISAEL
jgi:hypothetical protein